MQGQPRVVPSDDTAFREHVERLVSRHGFKSPDALEVRLRKLFPRVLVRASVVSGQEHIWYVYRDGVWRSGDEDRWWEDARVPRLSVSTDGWITDANASARSLLGLGVADALPRYFTDFVAPGTLEDARALFDVVADGRELQVTTVIRPAGGEVIACDLRAWLDGDHIVGAIRLAADVPWISAPALGPVPALDCYPRGDALFARYAQEALERMPEPTADGLALRLRRLYPHARVDVNDHGWTVHRDAQDVQDGADQWWRAAGLASVRYDDRGRITDANEAALALLGADLVGRHWQELVTAGTADEVAEVMRLIADVGWAESRFRLPALDGSLFEFDSYTEVTDGTFLTVIRPRSAEDPQAVALRLVD